MGSLDTDGSSTIALRPVAIERKARATSADKANLTCSATNGPQTRVYGGIFDFLW